MKKVIEFTYLYELLKSHGFGFMNTWYYVSSEGSNLDFQFVQAFENLDLPKELYAELDEEQSFYRINQSFCLIKGSVTILLIKG